MSISLSRSFRLSLSVQCVFPFSLVMFFDNTTRQTMVMVYTLRCIQESLLSLCQRAIIYSARAASCALVCRVSVWWIFARTTCVLKSFEGEKGFRKHIQNTHTANLYTHTHSNSKWNHRKMFSFSHSRSKARFVHISTIFFFFALCSW